MDCCFAGEYLATAIFGGQRSRHSNCMHIVMVQFYSFLSLEKFYNIIINMLFICPVLKIMATFTALVNPLSS